MILEILGDTQNQKLAYKNDRDLMVGLEFHFGPLSDRAKLTIMKAINKLKEGQSHTFAIERRARLIRIS